MRRSYVRLRMAVTLLAIFAVTPPPASGEDRVFRICDHQHGLPTDEVSDLTQDAAAFLWFATPGGLVGFDGSEMRRWNTGGRRVTRLAAADGFGVVAIDEAARLFRVNLSGAGWAQSNRCWRASMHGCSIPRA